MQLCVTLNDLEYMRLWLADLPVSLDWDDVVNAMERAHGTRGGQHARTSMEGVLNSADEDMMNKIAKAIEHIGNQVCLPVWLSFHAINWQDATTCLSRYFCGRLPKLKNSMTYFLYRFLLSFTYCNMALTVHNFERLWDVNEQAVLNTMKGIEYPTRNEASFIISLRGAMDK